MGPFSPDFREGKAIKIPVFSAPEREEYRDKDSNNTLLTVHNYCNCISLIASIS